MSREQEDRSTTFKEAKTITKVRQHCNWLQQHPGHNKSNPYCLLSRSQQVTVFRLCTGHTRLNHHLSTKFRISQSNPAPIRRAVWLQTTCYRHAHNMASGVRSGQWSDGEEAFWQPRPSAVYISLYAEFPSEWLTSWKKNKWSTIFCSFQELFLDAQMAIALSISR